MARSEPFERYPLEYDGWFKRNPYAYQSELEAVRTALPGRGKGIEIGVGSGRFAQPLGIPVGVEPSLRIGALAITRGIRVIRGIAEALPIAGGSFDYVLLVTTICFLDDMEKTFSECRRVLKSGGRIIIGLVDKDSALGKQYQARRDKSAFYRQARFYSAAEVAHALQEGGFSDCSYNQTLFGPLRDLTGPEPVREGSGTGAFIVVAGNKTA